MKTTKSISGIDKISQEEIKHYVYSLKYFDANVWISLECMINDVQENSIESIRQYYPLLSEDDIHIILLLLIGLSNREISRLCGILPASFRKRRYRLKKKMNIECNSISEFICQTYLK